MGGWERCREVAQNEVGGEGGSGQVGFAWFECWGGGWREAPPNLHATAAETVHATVATRNAMIPLVLV